MSLPRPQEPRDNHLLRAARVSANRPDGGARNRNYGLTPPPHRGIDPARSRPGPDYFTLMRANLTAFEQGTRVPLAVELDDVSFAYDPAAAGARDVDLEVPEGEFVAIAGPNGGGKTTLCEADLGLSRPQAGTSGSSASLSGRLPTRLVAYLAQRAQLGIDAPATVREVVAAGRAPGGDCSGRSPPRTATR